MRQLFTALLFCLMAPSGVAFGQAGEAQNLSGRIDYAIAYAPFLHALVLHGGWAPPRWRPTNEAWRWDGKSWSRWDVKGVPSFAHHTMAFDEKRNVLVICGRPTPHEGGEYQIWESDGSTWSRKADVPVGPNSYGDPKVTYDPRRGRLVLYVASYAGAAEVWEFDGKDWQNIKFAHQPVRCDDNGCLFQYDESIGKAVLVGESRPTPEPLAWDGREWGMNGGGGTQTWLWDGKDWVQGTGEQPPRAMWGGMTYDRGSGQLILLTTRMETWALRRARWEKLSPSTSPQPAPNGFIGLSYDPVRKLSLFFGGESRPSQPEKEWVYPSTTWIFEAHSWIPR